MKTGRFLLLFSLFLVIFGNGYAEESSDMDLRIAQAACGRGKEYVIELSDEWKFGGKDENAFLKDYDDSGWETVNLPHTWNILDGADGGSNYLRTAFWYRKSLKLDTPFEGKRIYLEFLGANQQTDLYVNGTHIKLSGDDLYTHQGGYTAFRFDITDSLTIGENTIAVHVDNRKTETTAPISGDFNIYGGIYRRVFLIAVDDVHFDLTDHGSSGLFLTTPNVRSLEKPADFGTLNIRSRLVNDGKTDRTVTVTAHIDGDHAPEDMIRQLTVPAGGSVLFDEDAFIPDPHLWKGITYAADADPSDVGYRYTVTLTVSDGEKTIDAVSDKVGFRYFYVDKEKGFFLNGESYPLRGVNRHQFKEGLGSALTEADHQQDLKLIMEMGANTIRLCHYPQADYVYELCDENGIIVWTEIPLVNAIGTANSFVECTKTQLVELIRQQYNRPSVCFWGLANELNGNSRNASCTVKELLSSLDGLVHQEDPSGRYSAQAVNNSAAMDQNNPDNLADDSAGCGWKSDLIGWNIYPGWYSAFKKTFESTISEKFSQDSRPIALSEFGGGGSAAQHEMYPELGKNGLGASNSPWHPEEYQSLLHEQALESIQRHDELWAVYAWVMFDFDVDSRNEGTRAGQNDKGLVSNDRTVKKDSFFLYKANWNQREHFVHIASSRYIGRESEHTYVKVYSNCDTVQLYQNGKLAGEMLNQGNGIFYLEDIALAEGDNEIRALGQCNGQVYEDACVWTWPVFATAELASESLIVDQINNTVQLDRKLTLGELKEALTGVDHAAYRVLLKGTEVTDADTAVSTDMTIAVTAENGMNQAVYSIVPYVMPYSITAEKKIWASSNQTTKIPENMLDRDTATSWSAADNLYPQTVILDVGEVCIFDALEIEWSSKNNKYYTYTIDVSMDGHNFFPAADGRGNRISGATSDDLKQIEGRYVKLTIHSCSDKSDYAMIYEIHLQKQPLPTPEEMRTDDHD